MKLRPPSVPLITVDPYFTVWSPCEIINHTIPEHWSGNTNSIYGVVDIDGVKSTFFGYHRDYKKLTQASLDIDAFSTTAVMENDIVKLTAKFTTPVLLDDLYLLTRPVSYLDVKLEVKDNKEHIIKLDVCGSEDLCLTKRGQKDIIRENVKIGTLTGMKMGAEEQQPLNKSGDDICIDWGYLYLLTDGKNAETYESNFEGRDYIHAKCDPNEGSTRFFFAYDDIYSMEYFKKPLKSYWNKDGKTIEQAIIEASKDYESSLKRCNEFSQRLYNDAVKAGGEKYAEILLLAYRQVIAAHKVVIDENGEILYISKECYSNGCGGTVDVSYPSTPLFLLYNTELVKGMMRPIYKYASSEEWTYDFAPHDVGQYPLLNGQVYGNNELKWQMPVEECGNMLCMEANIAIRDAGTAFAESHLPILEKWCEYLIEYGADPGNQLCTDDFAGHLAHNCNLSLKAIMGLQGMSIIMNMMGNTEKSGYYRKEAEKMAQKWKETAINGDGSTKLAFDQPNTYSMKYNMIWDKVWKTELFGRELMDKELQSNKKYFNKYGMPLDIRADYTKSDWLVWVASMASDKETFEEFINPLWDFYNETDTRVPMTDWYDTVSGKMVSFKHRSVQGGLFMKLMIEN